MFAQWVTHGAEIGVTAFFAIVVFALLCGVVLGILVMVARVFGEDV